MKTHNHDAVQKPSGLHAEAVVPNVAIVTDAILEEQTAADKNSGRPNNQRDGHLPKQSKGQSDRQ
jgi:hypothetical protein